MALTVFCSARVSILPDLCTHSNDSILFTQKWRFKMMYQLDKKKKHYVFFQWLAFLSSLISCNNFDTMQIKSELKNNNNQQI